MKKESISYESFFSLIQHGIMMELGDSILISMRKEVKNNSVMLNGISIQEDDACEFPTIYLDGYYKEYCAGRTHYDILSEIVDRYRHSRKVSKKHTLLPFSFSTIRPMLVFRLIHYEKNKTILEQVPHRRFLDLAITYHGLMEEAGDRIATFRISNEHCEKWQVEEPLLFQEALKNTPIRMPVLVESLYDIASPISADHPGCSEKIGSNLLVLSNRQCINGASCLLYHGILDLICERLGEDYFILPSSIHEVILASTELYANKEELCEIVSGMNQTEVLPEDILSDQVYLYSDVRLELQRIGVL